MLGLSLGEFASLKDNLDSSFEEEGLDTFVSPAADVGRDSAVLELALADTGLESTLAEAGLELDLAETGLELFLAEVGRDSTLS